MKKFLIFILVVTCILSSSIPAFATTHVYSSSYFNEPWEQVEGGSGWTMIYGYNEFAINEDYVHSLHSYLAHTSKITHSGHSHQTTAVAGSWANVDVVHSGSPVYYYMYY